MAVVFLFTDIEGSTTRWDARPEAMGRAVRLHDGIVRTAVEAASGRVFKTVGDAFCVVFDDPAAALRAAVEAQRALQGRDWDDVGGLRVRMALHAGEAEERDGDFFGGEVNRVARLLAAAHGGQIVASGALADAIGATPPDGISLRALGVFHLKDLGRPERVLQVVAEGLPAGFRPLRSLDAVPNNLPQQTSPFVGREADIAAVDAMLRASTLVTIAGPGGVGKTRLALQCAAEAIDRMKDGAWFVDLAPIADADFVAGTISAAIHEGGAGEALEALVEYLRDRELLPLLDNCEHLVGEVARVIDAIRARCPHVTILATTREALHLDGERVHVVAPFDAEQARALFVERMRAADARWAPSPADERAIATICVHLDGLPLAIELAAARARMLPLAEIAERLGERFRMLTGGARTALPRQKTLRALIDWSYDLLAEPERELFRRLAVFVGGFTLEAATALSEDPDEWATLDALTALVDKSMAATDAIPATRYRYLESIREYAREMLEASGALSEVRRRHATFFAGLAGRLYAAWDRQPNAAAVRSGFAEIDNLRAALQWAFSETGDTAIGARLAADGAPLFLHLSLLEEGIGWCKRALEAVGATGSDLRGRLAYVLSMFYNNQAEYRDALEAAERALPDLRAAGDERGHTRALAQVAQQYARAGRFEDARPCADEALALARATGDARFLADVTRRCAFALPPSEIERARAQFEGSAAALDLLGARDEACHLLEWWAEAEAAAGCFDRAIDLGTRALGYAPNATRRMHLTSNVAGYHLAAGNLDEALPLAAEALDLAVEANHALLTAIGIAYASMTRLAADPSEAARQFGYGSARMKALGWSGIASDEAARENILRRLERATLSAPLSALLDEGASWPEGVALERARA